MSLCSTCDFDPCECCGDDFTVLEGRAIDRTLIASLTGCVDSIRDLYTCFGARPYQVSLVWTRWSGGDRGVGAEEIVGFHRILPTPKVTDLSNLKKELTQVGMDEAGDLRVSEISPRYNEDLLQGSDLVVETGAPIPKDVQFYWEITFPRANMPGIRRRFIPSRAPDLQPTKFQWRIDLLRASEDRTRIGEIQ